MLKTILGSLREYRKPALLSPFFVIFEVILDCLIPLITADLINNIRAGNGMHPVITDGLILIVIALLSLVFGSLSALNSAEASAGFAKNLRHDMFERIQTFSFENIDKFSTGSLISRLTTDINNIQMAFMTIIRIAVRSPLMLIFAATSAVIVGKKLALIFAGVIPVLLFFIIIISRKAMRIFRRIFKKYDNMNSSVQENIKAMRVVKSFVREDHETEKFLLTSMDIRNEFTHAEALLAFGNPIMQMAVYTTMILISYFSAKLIVSSGATYIDVGALSGMITYSMLLLISLMTLSMVFVMIIMSSASARRISEILNEESTVFNCENPITEIPSGSIDFKNVSFKYSPDAESPTLSDINFHIDSGMTCGIIGGTGTGKSSLIHLISRLYDVTSGEVLVGGINVRKYDLEALRSSVAVVLQKNILFSGTIAENLRWGDPDATMDDIKHACHISQADTFIDTFPDGYDTMLEQGGSNLSGGQKQRLCIARALLKKPLIMILDDSTSAVDTKTDALIRNAFSKELPETTKIIISQRISSIEDADMIIVMDNGTVSDIGTHDELLERSEIYREVYTTQTKGGASCE